MPAMSQGSFSRRQGYTGQPQPITVREDAPKNLRYFVLETTRELGLSPSVLRDITCAVLEEPPTAATGANIRISDLKWRDIYAGANGFRSTTSSNVSGKLLKSGMM